MSVRSDEDDDDDKCPKKECETELKLKHTNQASLLTGMLGIVGDHCKTS